MKATKAKLVAITATMLLGGATHLAFAQDKATTPAPTEMVKDPQLDVANLTIVGEVVAVDQTARRMAVKGPEGNILAFPVGPEVRNFDQVKVGDRMVVDYRVGVALALLKGGDGIREKVESEADAVAKRGAKPGAAEVKRTTIVANVWKVDHKKHVVRLHGPEDRVIDVHVTDPKVMKDVKAGDQVVASITESVAIGIRPAPAKKK
jgi:hypothetical protein